MTRREMHYIVHQGHRPFRKNSIVSLLSVILHRENRPTRLFSEVPWAEMDVLYVHPDWVLCHDFETLSKRSHDRFADFWDCIQQIKTPFHLLLDIKWDGYHNRSDDRAAALSALAFILDGRNPTNLWLQFSDTQLYRRGCDIFAHYKKGYIVSDPIALHYFLGDPHIPDFFMVDIRSFHRSDLERLRTMFDTHVHVFGYTCSSHTHLAWILDTLRSYLDGIVCDVAV